MPNRSTTPAGAPNWVELWTSDVERAGDFYGKLFGWTATEPNPDLGGYFMFDLNGVTVAGAMSDMGDVKANNTWTPSFETSDIGAAASAIIAGGGSTMFDPMAVLDLGQQVTFTDPSGAVAGLWQPGNFPGFTTIDEHGAPAWFELHTPDHRSAVRFYGEVLGWEYDKASDVDEFRYYVVRNPEGGDAGMAGMMDNRNDIAEGEPAFWTTYFLVDDIDVSAATIEREGGIVERLDKDTPYGHLASVSDPMGARFALMQSLA